MGKIPCEYSEGGTDISSSFKVDSNKVESFEAYLINDKLVYINIVVKSGVTDVSSIATIKESKYNPMVNLSRGFVSDGNMTSIIVARKSYGDLLYIGNTSTHILSGSFIYPIQ